MKGGKLRGFYRFCNMYVIYGSSSFYRFSYSLLHASHFVFYVFVAMQYAKECFTITRVLDITQGCSLGLNASYSAS